MKTANTLVKSLLCSLTLFQLCQALEKSSFFSTVKRHITSTVEWDEEDWPNEPFNKFLARCRTYQYNPQPFRKNKVAFSIIEPFFQDIGTPACLDGQTLRDIELFCGDVTPTSYLANTLDRTHTQLGRVSFYSLLQPSTDIQTIKDRQEIVRSLVAHEELYQELTDILSKLALHEPILFSFWINDMFKQVSSRNYFTFNIVDGLDSYLNTKTTAVGLSSTFAHGQRAFWVACITAATAALPLYGAYTLANKEKPARLETVRDFTKGRGGPLLSFLSWYFEKNRWVNGVASIAAGVYCGIATKQVYQWFLDQFTLQRYMQEKLIDVASYFKQLKKLTALVEQHKSLFTNVPIVKELKKLQENPATAKLFTLLESSTCKGTPSVFSHPGTILVVYRLLHELKQELEPALAALGTIDAYYGIASLYKEHQDLPASFCFVEYSEQDTPLIELDQFWHPTLSPMSAVPNTVSIGSINPNNLVITGPNAGGKSTIIKAVTLSLILAQSIGIAPAQRCKITPFSLIQTYLNVPDDISSGNSLFKAQVKRIGELVQAVESVPEHSYAFLAVDELFNGTSKQEGEPLAFSVGQYLANYPNSCTLFATHFPLLTTLATKSRSCANYKVAVTKTANGTLSFPFILKPGISDQHIALDIVREEGFNKTIIKTAESLNTKP